MVTWRSGEVIAVRREWVGAAELEVEVAGAVIRALAYPALTGPARPGDEVLLNTGALDLGLGTGGYALVVAVPGRLPEPATPPGHLIKARYTPLQAAVAGADEPGSPGYERLAEAGGLDGMPVLIADLHSALPAALTGFFSEKGFLAANPAGTATGVPPRVAYVMTDGGALPAWFSRTAARLRELGWLAGVVTTGQAFGGDLEAVTLHSGLLAARHLLGAELAVVCQGPGNLGTGTTWGFSGLACGEAVNAVAVLGGRPIASLRISDADPRPRHQGISHHSLTAYGRVALARAEVVIPELPGPLGPRVRAQAQALGERHELALVEVTGLAEALRACPVRLSTMGRGLEADLAYFLAAAAAGRHAARPAAGLRNHPEPGPGIWQNRRAERSEQAGASGG